MDAVLLARLQFALTSIYHWLFVPVTLGMTVLVAIMEVTYARTKNDFYQKMAKFWGGLFLINFAMGVVTGIVQEFHFGMNWADYSRFMGDIFGAPLALEALTAFFLESTFMGVWIFGWKKLSPKAHAVVAVLVAIGTNLSAYWILVANSFMQHPVGYAIRHGRAEMTSFGDVLSNSYVGGQYAHVFFSGITIAGAIIASISAWHLLRNNAPEFYKKSVRFGLGAALIGTILVMGAGHFQGQYITKVQPMKIAAVEALWNTQDPAPFSFIANIDTKSQSNTMDVSVPGGLSFLTQNSFTSGKVQGLKNLQAQDEQKYGPGNYIPDVVGMFWTFRIMVLCGVIMFLISLVGYIKSRKENFLSNRTMLYFIFWMIPFAYIAEGTGWYVAEAGRQPWIVYGLQKTVDGVSPVVTAGEVLTTIIGFTVVYVLAAIAALYLASKHIKKGPEGNESHDVAPKKEEATLWN